MYGVPSNNSSNNVATRSTAFEKSNSVNTDTEKRLFFYSAKLKRIFVLSLFLYLVQLLLN